MTADSSILSRNADGPKSEKKFLGGKTTDMQEKKVENSIVHGLKCK